MHMWHIYNVCCHLIHTCTSHSQCWYVMIHFTVGFVLAISPFVVRVSELGWLCDQSSRPIHKSSSSNGVQAMCGYILFFVALPILLLLMSSICILVYTYT